MSIHPLAPRAERIRILQQSLPLPLRRSTLQALGLAPRPSLRTIAGPGAAKVSPSGRTPCIGAGLDLDGPPIDWSHPRLQGRFEPKVGARVGILGAQGLLRLGRRHGLVLHKVSVIDCGRQDFQRRIYSLEEDRYAGCWRSPDGTVQEEPGFDAWQLKALPPLRAVSPFSPVRPRHRFFDIRLPVGMTYKRFDEALTVAMAPARIDLWAKTAAAAARAGSAALADPCELLRLTAYDMGGPTPWLREATEILALMPDRQAFLLMAIIEEVLRDLVGWPKA
jgi:hypothetical protein